MNTKLLTMMAGLMIVATQATAADAPTTALPYTLGLDVSSMDSNANPCVDFYQYSCGGWMKKHPIPADQASWSVYGKLAQDNQRYLWGILDALANKTEGRNARQTQLGDYFAACMDERAIEARGAAPLTPHLTRIAALGSVAELPALLASLQLTSGTAGLFFGFGSNQDFADSSQVIGYVSAGGLGLPDRDYYVKSDKKYQDIRAQYVAHIETMLRLLGVAEAEVKRDAATVMRMETGLAQVSLTMVEKRDPYKIFHNMNANELRALTPSFDWKKYLTAIGGNGGIGGTGGAGGSGFNKFNVTEPAFFKAFDRTLATTALDEIKAYLRWHVLRANAAHLSSALVSENFNFFSKTLRGVQQQKPRWKRCVALVDAQLGEALGQEFVSRNFSPELKKKTQHMTKQIEKAFEQTVQTLPWMSAATKQRALEKLHAVANKIGYPDRWRDYRKLVVARDDYAGNVLRGNQFEARRDIAKIGKPLDRKEWAMTPPTVNAYYNPQMNDINFPAGVLQPPLYDPAMDDAPNYGNTGATIGHELTHGFDDEGRQFDAKGNLKDWWTAQDRKAFDERAQCVIDQYAQYTIVDDIKINSKLTLGEDIADLGGLVLGWLAWKMEVADKKLTPRDGLTPEQRYFVGYAQWACENVRPEDERASALTNPHSPGKYRVNGLMVNMPEFQEAFSCKAGQPMVAEKRCKVW